MTAQQTNRQLSMLGQQNGVNPPDTIFSAGDATERTQSMVVKEL